MSDLDRAALRARCEAAKQHRFDWWNTGVPDPKDGIAECREAERIRDELCADQTALLDALDAAEARIAELEQPTIYWEQPGAESGCECPEDIGDGLVATGKNVPGDVVSVPCAHELPDVWLALHPDTDGDLGDVTEHSTEAEARAALEATP